MKFKPEVVYRANNGVYTYCFHVISRTAKTVTIAESFLSRIGISTGSQMKRKIFIDRYGDEYCYPFGRRHAIKIVLFASNAFNQIKEFF